MKIYITRHGQVLNWGIGGDAQFPKGDPPLSPAGRQQGTTLGIYLKHLGFSGKIYSSPFARALETSEAIAKETGSLIVPWAPIREIVKTPESTANFTGLTLEEIRKKFRFIDPDATLPYPWWGLIPEKPEDVIARVKAGLDALAPTEDILLVGHGASVYCACEVLQLSRCKGNNYNCGFSMYDSEDENNFFYMDGAHLPYEMRTFNRVIQKEEDEKLCEELLAQTVSFPATSGEKMLCIRDTHSVHYPYLRKIIAAVQPDVIFHSGNFVYEVKPDRIPNMEEAYTCGLEKIAEILKNSGAKKIYALPGQSDIPEILQAKLPFAEFTAPIEKLPKGTLCLLAEGVEHSFPIPEYYHWNRI